MFERIVLASSYFDMFAYCLFEACSFLMRERKGEDLEGRGSEEEWGGVEGRETTINIV